MNVINAWEMDSRISIINRLRIQLRGHINRGVKEHPETKAKIEYFAFKCPIHGIVEDYPHGHARILECPKCRENKAKPLLQSQQIVEK